MQKVTIPIVAISAVVLTVAMMSTLFHPLGSYAQNTACE